MTGKQSTIKVRGFKMARKSLHNQKKVVTKLQISPPKSKEMIQK
jgi:hypothetical protein